MKQAGIILNKGRERSVLNGHPWIFSGAVHKVTGIEHNGQPAPVVSSTGDFLGIASVSKQSQIRARMWTRREEPVDADFIKRRIADAQSRRDAMAIALETDAFRIVNAESDGMPGLIVDRYADTLVCQFLSAGAEYFRDAVVQALVSLYGPAAVFERSDTAARTKEGLQPRTGLLHGNLEGTGTTVTEHGLKYLVNVAEGHKTGFYLDQRDNRRIVSGMARGAEVLNCFSYTGGFGLSALAGGAKRVVNVEASAAALEVAGRNAALNGFDDARMENITGDVFQELRKYRDRGIAFDLVVLDPPKFAESASQLEKAARGYKDINLLAMKLIRPGGLLFTFSCSGHMTPELFRKVVADAAADAGREVQVERFLLQAADHPYMLGFPEGLYLKGLGCRVW